MNRIGRKFRWGAKGIPHTRGDEPENITEYLLSDCVFPTHVGMNRKDQQWKPKPKSIPHTRGDEP